MNTKTYSLIYKENKINERFEFIKQHHKNSLTEESSFMLLEINTKASLFALRKLTPAVSDWSKTTWP